MTGNLIWRGGSVSSASSALLEPSGLFLRKAERRVQAADKRHVYFLTIKLVFISEERVLLIYLYIFYVVVVVFFVLLLLLLLSLLLPPQPRFCYLLARSACVCEERAVFRKTKQRQRGRLDPGCIRLGTEGAPSGSLEGEEGRRR